MFEFELVDIDVKYLCYNFFVKMSNLTELEIIFADNKISDVGLGEIIKVMNNLVALEWLVFNF